MTQFDIRDLEECDIDHVGGGMANPPPTWNGNPEIVPGTGAYRLPDGSVVTLMSVTG